MNNGFNAADLVDKTKMTEEQKYDPARIAKLIRDAAKQSGIMLKGPEKNCKYCHGRGWIGLNHETGDPICCRCIFFKEDLQNRSEEIPEAARKPLNRAERRKKKK